MGIKRITEIKLKFTQKEIQHLWTTHCQSFVCAQPDRFTLIKGEYAINHPRIKIVKDNGSLFYCDTFVAAKIIVEYYKSHHNTAVLLIDDDNDGWPVWVDIPYPK